MFSEGLSELKTSASNLTVADSLQVVEALATLESDFRKAFAHILNDAEFDKKYDMKSRDAFDGLLFYVFTTQPKPTPYYFVMEAFSAVNDLVAVSTKSTEELTYHCVFEDIIEKYTKTRKKPNPVLMETRSSNFCYLLTIKIEAIPLSKAGQSPSFLLLREFQILQHIWEQYRSELAANKCNTDQLIGFPMPFEFKNIEAEGTEYQLVQGQSPQLDYWSPSGKLEPILRVTLPSFGSTGETRAIKSTLSYMSMEKLGPSLSYLMDLMVSQGKSFTMSSALKVYDQLLCRLMIMHKHSVMHCDINPAMLSFGTGKAANVLYINSFESALIAPTTSPPLPYFNERFISCGRLKDKATSHFVHDLEAAFYIFLYLLLGRLPWDARLAAADQKNVHPESAGASVSVSDRRLKKSLTVDDKERFWQLSNQFLWTIKYIAMEFRDTSYGNFTSEIVESIYNKVKESVANCQHIGQAIYTKDVFIPSSAVYSAYFGIRKTIASYFRFETFSNSLRDPVWAAKTEMLLTGDANDKRIAWDLSVWCWNFLDMSESGSPKQGRISVML